MEEKFNIKLGPPADPSQSSEPDLVRQFQKDLKGDVGVGWAGRKTAAALRQARKLMDVPVEEKEECVLCAQNIYLSPYTGNHGYQVPGVGFLDVPCPCTQREWELIEEEAKNERDILESSSPSMELGGAEPHKGSRITRSLQSVNSDLERVLSQLHAIAAEIDENEALKRKVVEYEAALEEIAESGDDSGFQGVAPRAYAVVGRLHNDRKEMLELLAWAAGFLGKVAHGSGWAAWKEKAQKFLGEI